MTLCARRATSRHEPGPGPDHVLFNDDGVLRWDLLGEDGQPILPPTIVPVDEGDTPVSQDPGEVLLDGLSDIEGVPAEGDPQTVGRACGDLAAVMALWAQTDSA